MSGELTNRLPPLGAERLVEIRARVEREREEYPPDDRALRIAYQLGRTDRTALLAEVDRLRAALAEAERERLLLARDVLEGDGCDTHAIGVARRIVEAAREDDQ